MMDFVDTHCHIHSADYGLPPEKVIKDAANAGVTRLLCVGENLADSKLAVDFVQNQPHCRASVGIHPHVAAVFVPKNDDRHKSGTILGRLTELAGEAGVVAVGECGLDYHYLHSPKADQKQLLRWQIELALQRDLPLIFHVREAFDDFWPIFDEYQSAGQKLRGVVHSFSAGQKELDGILARNLYVGLNGIVTFTKNPAQLAAARAVPLQKLLLETDAPFLTPSPYRGTINESKHVRTVAEFLSELRGESLEQLAAATTRSAKELFGLR